MSDSKDNVIPFRKRTSEPHTKRVKIEIDIDADGHIVNAFASGDYDGDLPALSGNLYSLAWLVSDYHRDSDPTSDLPAVVFATYITAAGGFYLACRENDFMTMEQREWLARQLAKVVECAPLSSAEVLERYGETSQMQKSCSDQTPSFVSTILELTTKTE